MLCGCGAGAAETKQAVLVVTNTAAVSNTLALAGITFTFTNTPLNSSFIATTNSANATATNVNAALGVRLEDLTNVNAVTLTNANTILIEGQYNTPLTVTLAGNWGYVFYTTNQSSDGKAVTWPFPDSVDASQTTNQANEVVKMVGFSNVTERVATTAPALGNFVSATGAQSVSNKTLVSPIITGGTNSGTVITNATIQGGALMGTQLWTVLIVINGDGDTFTFLNGNTSNRVMRFQDGTNVFGGMITNTVPREVYLSRTSSVATAIRFLDLARFLNPVNRDDPDQGAVIFGQGTSDEEQWNWRGIDSAGTNFVKDTNTVVAYRNFSPAVFSYDLELPHGNIVLADGITLNFPTIGGGTISGATLSGRTVVTGAVAHLPVTVSSLAAGNNVLTRGTPGSDEANMVVFGAGPSSTATICAIAAASRAGDWFIGINGTGYDLILTNESGFTAVETNRLRLPDSMTGMRIPPDGQFRALFDVTVGTGGRWRVDGGASTNFAAISVNGGGGTNNTFTNATLQNPTITSTNVTGTGPLAGHAWTATSTNGTGTWGGGLVPIGGVLPWMKSLTNTIPALPEWFVECNGQTLTDTNSVFYGLPIPNLNGNSSGTNFFLRGNTTSGPASIGLAPTTGSNVYNVVWVMRVK
jgi:hypothetical protein